MARLNPPDSGTESLVQLDPQSPATTALDLLKAIPEEQIWLASRKSPRTRRAYRHDVAHFMRTLGIRSTDDLARVDHKAVLALEAYMREAGRAEASTVRRRLAALSSLFKHLVKHGVVERNPVRDVERPPINRREGFTSAFSKVQARRLLDLPRDDTVAGLRDRAVLSVGLQVGLRRAEIAALRVGDLHVNRGFDSLRVVRKRAKMDALAINPQTAQRIRAYLAVAGHGDDFDVPLFRPLRHNGRQRLPRRHLDPDAIDRIVKKYAARIGLTRGYSAHSMRARFITTALDNGCSLEDVQRAAGHADPSTTKLYDRSGLQPREVCLLLRELLRLTRFTASQACTQPREHVQLWLFQVLAVRLHQGLLPMLDLQLRDEFLGTHTPGTAISLRRNDNTGAAQQPPERILEITYPTADVQNALRALSRSRPAKPMVLLGDRGRGKSHIMAVMHHATMSPDVVQQWARNWGARLGNQFLSQLELQTGYFAISEAVHNHEYPFLWDLLFDRHPQGERFRGRFEQSAANVPSRSLLEDMFSEQPVVLILDEFQKWFDGLPEVGRDGTRQRDMASNFVQNLSELSRERPELVLLVISVLNNTTEAFQQVHRDTPVIVNFQGPTAKQDRQQLLLHRLFKNRDNIPQADIERVVRPHAEERYRLRFSHLPASEQARIVGEVVTLWPFAPDLVSLLEDHILMAEAAQETRDLIRILAAAYRERGDATPLITAADFFVDQDTHGVQALLDSIATHGAQSDLLEIAQRNLDGIRSQGAETPHSREIISALWMRSMTPGREAGGTKEDLQLDITRDAVIDDNAFLDELLKIKDHSINIHGSDNLQGRIWFGRDENAKTKVRATARNDRLWAPMGTPAATTSYPGKDLEHIRKTLRHILVPETRQSVSKVIVLGPGWETDPWSEVDEADRPDTWTQPVLLVLPTPLDDPATPPDSVLGAWLASKVQSKRNTVRFLLPAAGSKNLFQDADLRFIARCSYLTSQAWRDDPRYRGLATEFDRPLREELRGRFDRFAVLSRWNYRDPAQCRFDIERIDGELVRQKGAIPLAVDEQIKRDLFDATEFQTLVIESARNSDEVSKLIDGLKEPPPSADKGAIPFLGDTPVCEEILKVAAKGKIVLNVAGTWVGRLPEHSDEDEALRYIRPKAFRGTQEMRQVQLALPAAAGSGAVSGPTPTPTPPGPQPPGPGPGPGPGPQPPGPGPGPQPPGPGPVPPVPPTPATTEIRSTDGATTIVNLIGSFERWGLPTDASLDKTRIEFEGLSVQQAKAILQRLPSNVRAKLEIAYRPPREGGDGA